MVERTTGAFEAQSLPVGSGLRESLPTFSGVAQGCRLAW